MKFRVSQEEFLKILTIVGKSLSSKGNLPILSNVLINASKNKIEIISTNLETAIRVSLNCKVEGEGKTTVSGKTFLEFISQLPPGEIVCEQLGDEVLVSLSKYKGRFPTIAADEFPAIPKIDEGWEIKMGESDFAKAANQVTFCASADEGRPVLTGVLFDANKNNLTIVATDGFRLSFKKIAIKTPEKMGAIKIIVPARAVFAAAKIIEEGSENIDSSEIAVLIAQNFNQIEFKIGSVRFTSRLIEGEFPAWQKIIPESFTTKIKVNKDDFVKLVRIASIFAREAGNIVRLKIEGPSADGAGVLTVLASASQAGSSDAQIPINVSGGGGEIAFNFRYLLEGLGVIEGDEVDFEMIESLNPGRIKGTDEKDSFFHIIMPVRLQT